MCARTNPQPPEARVPHADDKRGGKRLCSHRPDKNKRGAGILGVPSLFTPPSLSQPENPDYFSLLSRPRPHRRLHRRKQEKGKSIALSAPDGSASATSLLLSTNTSIFPKSGGIMQQQRGRGGGGELEPARSTCRREGAAIKAATLRWRVPSPDKAAKVYVTKAPRTLAAAGQPRAQPGPRPAPGARASRERAGSPGRAG